MIIINFCVFFSRKVSFLSSSSSFFIFSVRIFVRGLIYSFLVMLLGFFFI